MAIDKRRIESAICEVLKAIGEDPQRQGLIDTPSRVADMFAEIFAGYSQDPEGVIKIFEEAEVSEGIVTVKNIPFYSMCEHHLMPFFGEVHIAYIPKNKKILGLSKFARVVGVFSKQLQIQEKLTAQIANFLYDKIDAKGIVVLVQATHLCVTMRGAKSFGSKTETMQIKGIFREKEELLQQALCLLK
ncbi:MAG: GTP cyclohydrolase I FolE [Clostridia bacterium]|nr:GTP cyclohydrolase I FolE [Clostridia bacterium]